MKSQGGSHTSHRCRPVFLARTKIYLRRPEKPAIFWPLVSLILHRPEKSPNFWPLLRYGPRWPEKRQISWPGHDCETGYLAREAARQASMPVSRSKQAARATPMGSLRLLCAPSPISRLYFSLGLSTRTSIFMDRSLKFVLASTEIPVFMDKTAHPPILSIITVLLMDNTQTLR